MSDPRELRSQPEQANSPEQSDAPALQGNRRRELSGLPKRAFLTLRHHGWQTTLFRAITFPLRFTPLRERLKLRSRWLQEERRQAVSWYRRRGEPVSIVIPSYEDAERIETLVAKIKKTVPKGMARVIVADDASSEEHVNRLRAIPGIEVIAGEQNRGFAANVNRGLQAADPDRDVVVLNSDVEPQSGWLACLQRLSRKGDDIGIVGARLLYPDGRIQFAGSVRNLGAPEWFDHRHRFKPADWGPASTIGPTIAVTGACMYLRRELLRQIGFMDEAYPMAFEDVDYCLRAWQAGFKVLYCPTACLVHHESVTRGTEVGEREKTSQRVFWERWGELFDGRDVHTEDGKLRIVYVTQDTGVGGGHRVVFEHLNGLHDKGHEVSLYSLDGPPDWFDLRVPVRTFEDYDELVEELGPLEAIKVATWWGTAIPVWQASVLEGIPVYFVQDIETSYYPDSERARFEVLDSYRPEFRYMTTSGWNIERLQELGVAAEMIPPGVDLATFHEQPEVQRRESMVLALGRTNPLKNLPLTLAAWRLLPSPRPELCMFGIEPELATDPGMRYVKAPTDEQIARLLAEATVFVQTSTHEGFCLPVLESMASGGAVVCTDAHGNQDFCRDGENCLMTEPDPASVSAAIRRLLEDPKLRQRLGEAGVQTAADYSWERRVDALEAFLISISKPRWPDMVSQLAR